MVEIDWKSADCFNDDLCFITNKLMFINIGRLSASPHWKDNTTILGIFWNLSVR